MKLLNPGGENTVYIETILFMNLVMDCYLLILVCLSLKLKTNYKRVAISSCIGSAGYGLILVLQMLLVKQGHRTMLIQSILPAAGMLILGSIMVKLTCQTKGLRELLRGMGYLYTISFILGGFIFFIKNNLPGFEKKCGPICLIMGAALWGFVLCRKIITKANRKKNHCFCRVELKGDEGPLQITALIDTGNSLEDPITHKPVAILSDSVWQSMQRCKKPDKFKIIPYHSIGKKNGVMEGYEIEGLAVKGEIGWIRHENVIIAVSTDKISVKDSYQMILPPELAV